MADIYQGKKMQQPDGVFSPLLKHFLETMLESELENPLEKEKVKAGQILTFLSDFILFIFPFLH